MYSLFLHASILVPVHVHVPFKFYVVQMKFATVDWTRVIQLYRWCLLLTAGELRRPRKQRWVMDGGRRRGRTQLRSRADEWCWRVEASGTAGGSKADLKGLEHLEVHVRETMTSTSSSSPGTTRSSPCRRRSPARRSPSRRCLRECNPDSSIR